MDRDMVGDEELARRAREGDTDAFAELWARHSGAGLAAARQFGSIAEADDLVAEAYLRILRAFQRGGGPSEAFRPYLYRTIRNVALSWKPPAYSVSLDDTGELVEEDADPEIATAENTITVRAFRTLPERWQTVLWYTEVEGMDPAEIAPLIGLAPNAVAALAYRARDGLKKAWLQAHVSDLRVPAECRWTTERMGEYVRGGLTRRARARFEHHLAGCTRCSILVEEVDDVGGRLAAILLPTVLGGGAGAALLAERLGSARETASAQPSDPSGTASAVSGVSRPAQLATASGVLVAAVVIAGVAVFAMHGAFSPSPPVATGPDTVEPSPLPTTSAPPTAPPTVPDRTPPPSPPPPPAPPADPPVEPPIAPPDTTAPTAPAVAAPIDGALLAVAAPMFTGTAEPGGIVEVERLAVDGVTVLERLGVATAGMDGAWSVESPALADAIHLIRVTVVDAAGNRSSAVTRTLVIDTLALPPVVDALPPVPHYYLPVITGVAEPFATVELRDDLGALLGTSAADAAGAWGIPLPDPLRDDSSLTAVQTDPAGNRSAASAVFGPIPFERPELLAPSDGDVVPSTSGATSVTVRMAGVEGMRVQVFVDGVTTGNIHTLEAGPIDRVTVPLPDGAHAIGVRYFDPATDRAGSIASVSFVIG